MKLLIQILQLTKFNLKMIVSPKYILCVIFSVLLPFAVNFPANSIIYVIFEIYLPILGIILMCDITEIESKHNSYELYYITKSNKKLDLFSRVLVHVCLLFICILIIYGVVYYANIIHEIDDNIFSFNATYFWKLVNLSLPSAIFLGLFSMSVSFFTRNFIMGSMIGILYWFYWQTNLGSKSVLNLFSYSSGATNYITSKIIYILLSIVILVIINQYIDKSRISNKSNVFCKMNRFYRRFVKLTLSIVILSSIHLVL